MAIYLLKSDDPAERYYSETSGGDIEAKKKSTFKNWDDLDAEDQAYFLSKWEKESEGGETVKASTDAVAEITAFIKQLNKRADESSKARLVLVKELLAVSEAEATKETVGKSSANKYGDYLEDVRASTGVGYNIIEGWISTKKDGKVTANEGFEAVYSEVAKRAAAAKSN